MPYLGKQPASVPVTADDIPNDSITTAKIVDAAITIADIGPNAVGNSEMADDAIGLNELSATGTTNSSTFLRGDNTWAVPPTTDISGKLNLSGGAMTGAITTNSTFDGVDIATRDAVLTSTTTTANAALPKAGGTMTGTIAGFTSTGIDDNADATAITIDSSENVGIGTTSPTNKLTVDIESTGDGIDLIDGDVAHGITDYLPTNVSLRLSEQNATEGGGRILGATDNTGQHAFTVYGLCPDSAVNTVQNFRFIGAEKSGTSIADVDADKQVFSILNNATQLFTVTGSGKVGIGSTNSANSAPAAKLHVSDDDTNPLCYFHQSSSSDIKGIIMQHGRGLSGYAGDMIQFKRNDGTEVGSVVIGAGSTSYNTSSDYRLKENVDYTWDATTRLKKLKPARFNFIADDSVIVDGFLAHEVSSIVPEAISGTKDAVETWQSFEDLPDGVSVGDNKLDDDGNTIPKYQGIDQSKLVPLLVKAMQEQQTTIEALTARITALEG